MNSYASSSCYYGPPGVTVTRLCAANGVPAPSAIAACRTVISSNFLNIKNSLLNVSLRNREICSQTILTVSEPMDSQMYARTLIL